MSEATPQEIATDAQRAAVESYAKDVRGHLASKPARLQFDEGIRVLDNTAERFPTIKGSEPERTAALQKNAVPFFDRGGKEIDRAFRMDGVDVNALLNMPGVERNGHKTVGELIASMYMEMVGCSRSNHIERQ